jgi:molybdenum cofactor cytidylyltransferase
MKLSAAFRLADLPRLALVGAGGKSSALFWLAKELVKSHQTVILTTTTHLGARQVNAGDVHLVIKKAQDIPLEADFPTGIVVATGLQADARRFAGLAGDSLTALYDLANRQQLPLLIEADGARLLPLKAPAEHEPVIPAFISTVIVCAGMEGLGKPFTGEWVHRPEQFARLSALGVGELITPEALSRVLMHPLGGLKNIPPEARRILLLTQADSDDKQAQAHAIAMQVQQAFHSVVIARLPRLSVERREAQLTPVEFPDIYAVHAPIAGVVLAAGGASRYGRLKQLLEWQGRPLVRHAVLTALQAGLSPVVVVTGAGADLVGQAVAGLPARQVYNDDWQQGQSTSMQAGLQALPATIGGAMFLLADQPNTPPGLIQALVEAHSQSLAPIVAPLVDGQRGNPVLFDPVTFEHLMRVTGDTGGRQIFAKFPLRYVPWYDRAVLLDLDEPQDYTRLTGEEQTP